MFSSVDIVLEHLPPRQQSGCFEVGLRVGTGEGVPSVIHRTGLAWKYMREAAAGSGPDSARQRKVVARRLGQILLQNRSVQRNLASTLLAPQAAGNAGTAPADRPYLRMALQEKTQKDSWTGQEMPLLVLTVTTPGEVPVTEVSLFQAEAPLARDGTRMRPSDGKGGFRATVDIRWDKNIERLKRQYLNEEADYQVSRLARSLGLDYPEEHAMAIGNALLEQAARHFPDAQEELAPPPPVDGGEETKDTTDKTSEEQMPQPPRQRVWQTALLSGAAATCATLGGLLMYGAAQPVMRTITTSFQGTNVTDLTQVSQEARQLIEQLVNRNCTKLGELLRCVGTYTGLAWGQYALGFTLFAVGTVGIGWLFGRCCVGHRLEQMP